MPSRNGETTVEICLARQDDEFRTAAILVERQLAVGNDQRRTGAREFGNRLKDIIGNGEGAERLRGHLDVQAAP